MQKKYLEIFNLSILTVHTLVLNSFHKFCVYVHRNKITYESMYIHLNIGNEQIFKFVHGIFPFILN